MSVCVGVVSLVVLPSWDFPVYRALSAGQLVPVGIIGRGASGLVRKCVHRPSLRLVALKSIDVFERNRRHQMIQELRVLRKLSSPYIVGFLGGYFQGGQVFLGLEYLDRGSLEDIVQS